MTDQFQPQAFQIVSGPITSPEPINNLFGAQIVDRVHKAVTIENPSATDELKLKAGAILAKGCSWEVSAC